MSDAIYIALVGFLSAIAGGVIQAWAHRNFEAKRFERQNRTDAYLGYLNGISDLSFARSDEDISSANRKIADARGRIALSGSAAVVATMVASFDFGDDLHSQEARKTHARVIAAMRADCLIKPGSNVPDDLFVMLYGREKRARTAGWNRRESYGTELPDWYPLANATDDEITSWLTADVPPYEEMRTALPWLTTEDQLDSWLNGMRAANLRGGQIGLGNVFQIPAPPRRMTGRSER